ncbi:MAG: hypothetical protein COV98_02445 [Candidatus Altarchaeum sp. CG12_big_fil_rev_8_21_14_0_65_33_22]|nr:MAG: hypothetical protein AUK59_02285 [Candidatus Altarchaeum sp. CG2_30_32_3053]PIN67572.1 MAG: hypothetical protein COV98_02445 [Candidatus Altarchaeum sp. CG12_big_fil_rev_8_21_14_0_65_33_22]PIV27249.1 MAG: hypothetical protein COS36_06415 [Candidatus Altarchaeum sp. CG03_land_8_20_14_0_80_32_618]PIZ33262.1 MAG: hypothetical protein COY41_00035 [Candidatus Altarchaeum sp. CG_4_10_14_0_8_um_filter_32_851]
MKTCSFQYLKNLKDFLKIETEGFSISKFHFENKFASFGYFKKFVFEITGVFLIFSYFLKFSEVNFCTS